MATPSRKPGQPTMVRLRDKERAAVKLVAEQEQTTMSAVIRRAVLKDLRASVQGNGEKS